MSKRLNGSSLFTGILSGVNGTYSQLANIATDGKVTAETFTDLSGNSFSSYLNSGMVSYLQSNFASIDKNSDGIMSAEEVSTIMSNMYKSGFSMEQLTQLGTQSGLSSSLLDTVMTHFNEIDTNKDGKVTNEEINAYGINSESEKAKLSYEQKKASDMSTFYQDLDSTDNNTYSGLLSYRLLSDDDD